VFKELAQNNKKIKFLYIDIDHVSETEGLCDIVNKIKFVTEVRVVIQL
jgi:predicted RNA-binding protein with EMAP domain